MTLSPQISPNFMKDELKMINVSNNINVSSDDNVSNNSNTLNDSVHYDVLIGLNH